MKRQVEKPVIQCIEKVMEVPQYTVQEPSRAWVSPFGSFGV